MDHLLKIWRWIVAMIMDAFSSIIFWTDFQQIIIKSTTLTPHGIPKTYTAVGHGAITWEWGFPRRRIPRHHPDDMIFLRLPGSQLLNLHLPRSHPGVYLKGGVRSKQSQLMLHKRPSILWQHQLITRWFFLISPTIWTKNLMNISSKKPSTTSIPKKTSEFSFITFFSDASKKVFHNPKISQNTKHHHSNPHHPAPNSNLPSHQLFHLKEIHCCLNSP